MAQNIHVALGDHSYDITIERGLLARCGEVVRALTKCGRIHLLTDENVSALYADAVAGSLRGAGFTVSVQVLPAGESTKQLPYLAQVWSAMSAAGITRKDLLVALGGGVIGDLGGFAAATFLRGIDFVQIPTSLLAQVDSSVGGKVAIDLPEGKNLAGAFYQPKAVLIDPDVLNTLSDRFFEDGMGEVIKYGCIRSKLLFHALKAGGSRAGLAPYMEEIIAECVDIKRQVVENDERDTGERMILNFGHTLGHAIETAQAYHGYTHGAAVAAGMHLITRISESKGMTQPGTADEIAGLLKMYHLPLTADKALAGDMLRAITKDKKNLGAALNIILLRQIGECCILPTTPAYFTEVETWLKSSCSPESSPAQ